IVGGRSVVGCLSCREGDSICTQRDHAMKNRSMDLLKYQAFPELGEAVRARAQTITERWQNAVEETLPQANRLTLEQLRDELPLTLDQMALALEASDPKP